MDFYLINDTIYGVLFLYTLYIVYDRHYNPAYVVVSIAISSSFYNLAVEN